MIYLLEHKYCKASLSFQFVKNCDQAVADVLIQAKAETDLSLATWGMLISERSGEWITGQRRSVFVIWYQ